MLSSVPVYISLWCGVILLLAIFIWEIVIPKTVREGFENSIGMGVADSAFWARWFPRRGDIGPGSTFEDGGYLRDIRYYNNYADIQGLGRKNDFCRMVQRGGDEKEKFFACALAGTDGLSTLAYRTPSVRQGFELSRDDYMRDVLKQGRDAYCRILKQPDGTFWPICLPAGDEKFQDRAVTDTQPPEEIATLLEFYEGIMVWLRLRDDMVDYAKNIRISRAGNIFIEEMPPSPPKTDGLRFNGVDQFLRISDSDDLSIGEKIQVRYMRSFCFWVYFDEFTNNAHIFDFGNGAGKENVWIGIQGRGDPSIRTGAELRPLLCGNPESAVLPESPSGPQPPQEVSPEELMLTTDANVNEYDCPKPAKFGRRMPPLQPVSEPKGQATSATFVYEVWEGSQRKMHIQIPNFFPLNKWTHVCITAKNEDAFRPDIQVFKNGVLLYEEESGHLPQNSSLTNNYIGRSNWMNVTSQMENSDQLFHGRLFDFRIYKNTMSAGRLQKTLAWGAAKLEGVDSDILVGTGRKGMGGASGPLADCRPHRVKRAAIINRPPAVNSDHDSEDNF